MRRAPTATLVMAWLSVGLLTPSVAVSDTPPSRRVEIGSARLANVPDEPAYPTSSTGPDIIVGDLMSVLRHGRVGDVTAFSVGTNVCNVGNQRVNWVASTRVHPVWGQGMYRLKSGRFEQIGMSWMAHGFYALSQSLCSLCEDPTDGAELGVGCSTSESAYCNGVQANMSRRSDVDAYTGHFPYPPDSLPFEGTDPTAKRIQVHDADLDPDLNPGAMYFVEAHFIAADDAAAGNGNNNASYRRVAVAEQSPNSYLVMVMGTTQREQPAIRAWQDADPTVHETDIQVPGEGLFILAVKVTQLGNGFWHYEYALQNLNSDRSAGSFSVPTLRGTVVENIGFHDVDYHSGDVYDLTDWPGVPEDGAVVWSTEPYEVNPNANALRFDTLYNFRFDANVPPETTVVSVGLFKPGAPNEVAAVTIGPKAWPELDCNHNRIWDGCDIECGDECELPCGQSADCNGNYIPDECETDCNANGIADACDIRDGLSSDRNVNGTPDECEPDCDADGDRDLRDFAALQRCYGGSDEDSSFEPPSTECTLHFDFDEDGDVDWDDFRVFQVECDGPSPARW